MISLPTSRIKTIFQSALIVGTLDIIAAFAQYAIKSGKAPFKPVLTFVASGLFGKQAFTTGDGIMAAGLLIHYCVAAAFTVIFFLVLAKTQFAKRQKLVTGILYGAFVWVVMNLLVLPITNAPKLQPDFWSSATGMLILIVCIGLPLSFLAASSKPAQSN
jgi:hypothetical protein